MERDLELNYDFFLSDNVVHENKIIPKKTIKKRSSGKKNYSPTKVKSLNFLKKISYNRLKSIDFDNASFIIDCFTYILFSLNPFVLQRKFEQERNREYVKTL